MEEDISSMYMKNEARVNLVVEGKCRKRKRGEEGRGGKRMEETREWKKEAEGRENRKRSYEESEWRRGR